jgi:hypothetical protein
MESFIPFIIYHEAGGKFVSTSNIVRFELSRGRGYSNDPNDPGGPTMIGVTIRTYTAYCKKKGYPAPSEKTLQNIPYNHWKEILKTNFWDWCRADEIEFQPLRWIIVDWVWASGPKVIRRIQRILKVKADGIIGPKTLAAINGMEGDYIFALVRQSREAYIDEKCRENPKLEKYRKGWLKRLSHIKISGLYYGQEENE